MHTQTTRIECRGERCEEARKWENKTYHCVHAKWFVSSISLNIIRLFQSLFIHTCIRMKYRFRYTHADGGKWDRTVWMVEKLESEYHFWRVWNANDKKSRQSKSTFFSFDARNLELNNYNNKIPVHVQFFAPQTAKSNGIFLKRVPRQQHMKSSDTILLVSFVHMTYWRLSIIFCPIAKVLGHQWCAFHICTHSRRMSFSMPFFHFTRGMLFMTNIQFPWFISSYFQPSQCTCVCVSTWQIVNSKIPETTSQALKTLPCNIAFVWCVQIDNQFEKLILCCSIVEKEPDATVSFFFWYKRLLPAFCPLPVYF